jgi:hypothetical protein
MLSDSSASSAVRMVSPLRLALIASTVFVVSWVFPPSVYGHFMGERDLLFLDPTTALFYALCVVLFLIGVWVIARLFPMRGPRSSDARLKVSAIAFLLIPVVIGIGGCIASGVLMLQEYPDIILALSSAQGEAIKNSDLSQHAPLGLANIWLVGVLWWAVWEQSRLPLSSGQRFVAKCVIGIGFVCCLVDATLKVSRVEVILPIIGGAIVYACSGAERPPRRHSIVLGVVGAAVVGLFLAFDLLRGGLMDGMVANLIGYTMTSYNRLSAVLDGRLRYEFGGRGTYLFPFLAFNNQLNTIIPFRMLFHWPTFNDWWQSEFTGVWDAGLNGGYIWSGTFGYIFADLGWLSPIWLFVYGLFYGCVWRSMKSGSTAGVVLYPWFGFCILFWSGNNYLVDNKLLVLVLDAAALSLYKGWLSSRSLGAARIEALAG